MGALKYLQSDKFWDRNLLSQWIKPYEDLDGHGGSIVIVAGEYASVHEVNDILKDLNWALVVVTSDERNVFPIDALRHPNMVIYSMYPNAKFKNVSRWLPIGYPPQAEMISVRPKTIPWYFAGQVNHESRRKLVEVLEGMPTGKLVTSAGFAQGLGHKEYYKFMSASRIAICPRGNVSPDSFRLWESLEAGCVPIVEGSDWWQQFFPEHPFSVVDDWEHLPGVIDRDLRNFPERQKQCLDWWEQYKLNVREILRKDVSWLMHKSQSL